jgi:hypothetical protein
VIAEAEGDDLLPGSVHDADEVLDHRLEVGAARAAPEVQTAVAPGAGARPVQQVHQMASDERVLALALVRQVIGAPQIEQAGRLGPQAKDHVVVVLEDDAPAGPDRPDHLAHHREWIRDVLEHEARVRDVEGAPLVVDQGQLRGVAPAQVEQMLLAVILRLFQRLGQLRLTALNAQNLAAQSDLARQKARELAQTGAHVEHALALAQLESPERVPVEQRVQPRKPLLLLGTGAMHVVEVGTPHRPGFTR